ncbi:hypothetical protein CK203_086961 [Vitis vinifera]|uniref:DUF8040 domain-containing protein n=1 Tax=Vitis vinifera TaxID=29760 RepID=A0A438FK56_VITVI|nr:hypothetical protein CK203_086961 [Vitis vinifera]
MFLTTIGHELSNMMIQERFQHSDESESRWFEIVLDVVCLMAMDITKPSDPQFKKAEWEGAAHDAHVFLEALRRLELGFPHPPRGKYYLVDVVILK